jgi:excinuclease UvrABC nuclease subunit
MWSQDVVYLSESSRYIPNQGGIYIILRDDGVPGRYTNIYVGKADDLHRRFLEHLSSVEPNINLRNNLLSTNPFYFRYFISNSENERTRIESELLRDKTWLCNIQGQ